LGSSIAIGDIDGDGYSDLAMGAMGNDDTTENGNNGNAYIFMVERISFNQLIFHPQVLQIPF